ncbi:MAG TPA: terminase small subunit [Rhodanobacteraceae bacterium]|nr:terminase small subunit [Rhodanobacteraceae bacterium]
MARLSQTAVHKVNGRRAPNLTPRQQRFVGEYLIDLNATQAAIRARYSAKTAEVQGPRLLGNVRVAAAIKIAQAKRAEMLELTAASITKHLMAIADTAEAEGSVSGLNVARQALMDVAKLNGLIVETHETIVRSPEERAARLAELRAERERLRQVH